MTGRADEFREAAAKGGHASSNSVQECTDAHCECACHWDAIPKSAANCPDCEADLSGLDTCNRHLPDATRNRVPILCRLFGHKWSGWYGSKVVRGRICYRCLEHEEHAV